MQLMDPLVFEPYARPQVWGKRRLETLLGKRLPASGAFGESWEISAHPHHVSRVAEGPYAGERLDELWRERHTQIAGQVGDSTDRFPLLIKYLDCDQQLSVQVHPNDEAAARLIPGELGKTEAWVILEAESTARIYAGLKPGTSRDDVEHCLREGTLADCLHSFAPRPGDCIFLPAGTVHAVGGGVLMAEVQQSSDATFRLFDWNRPGSDGKPRPLHIEQSLESMDWSAGPNGPLQPEPIVGLPAAVQGELLVRCPYFGLSRFRFTGPLAIDKSDRPTIWMLISGQAELSAAGNARKYYRLFTRGESVLVPAESDALTWTASSPAELLRVHF
jgi:mannose-6-phosphate isomerase